MLNDGELLQSCLVPLVILHSLAQVITDRLTGKNKGYGFVRFTSVGERDQALRHMDGHMMGGKAISVSEATLKK